MDEKTLLSQSEIDALLNGPAAIEEEGETGAPDNGRNNISTADSENLRPAENIRLEKEEIDALGEIGNITMGSASTTLSELLQQKVVITSPKVKTISQSELFNSFDIPYVVIQVEYVTGLGGLNVLVLRLKDAGITASLMMGGDGTPFSEEIGEMEISAASEAMNQMIGTASTALSNMFSRPINISPPVTKLLQSEEAKDFRLPAGDPIVVISFNMQIGNLLDTEIMQVLTIETAKEEAALLWEYLLGMSSGTGDAAEDVREPEDLLSDSNALDSNLPETESQVDNEPSLDVYSESDSVNAHANQTYKQANVNQKSALVFPGLSESEQQKMSLLLDVPLKISVVLGRTKKPIKEVLNLTPGAIVELQSLVDEPVEILVNGTLVAKGEVVVVNENFGVRINSILSPKERLIQLKS